MKVFMCKRTGGYSGGLVVVAANTLDEAFETFAKDERYKYLVEWYDWETSAIIDDVSKIDSEYYPRDNWFEVSYIIANVDKPCVIAECGYTE